MIAAPTPNKPGAEEESVGLLRLELNKKERGGSG